MTRRSLSDEGGKVRSRGPREEASLLARALRAARPADADTLTHGFHSYPAKLHPAIARTLLSELSDPSIEVVDPFCGSGTVLVEARVAGIRSVGLDLNPLALRIAEVKTLVRSRADRRSFRALVDDVAERSLARVQSRVDSRADLPPSEREWYETHTLKELAGLLEEIRVMPDSVERRCLELLFSALVVKFSKQRSDTSSGRTDRRIRKGLPTEFFQRKGHELVRRWAALEAKLPAGSPAPRLVEADARRLKKHVRKAALIVTSPPYGGTYDYADHHARRIAWLGLDVSRLRKNEIGPRRRQWTPSAAEQWDQELRDVVAGWAGTLTEGGNAIVLLGDAQIGKHRRAADVQVESLIDGLPLSMLAAASIPRRDPRGRHPRLEHLLWLRRT